MTFASFSFQYSAQIQAIPVLIPLTNMAMAGMLNTILLPCLAPAQLQLGWVGLSFSFSNKAELQTGRQADHHSDKYFHGLDYQS